MSYYYPEKIIDSKFVDNKIYYHVKWKGYKETTWEPEHHIEHRTDLISEYNDMMSINNLNFMKNGYIYCRVSSKEQSKYDKGHTSLEVQEKTIKEYCQKNEINVVKCVTEVYSARNMGKMKGLQYLMNIASSGQTIYVYDISRFSRNIQHGLNILDDLSKKNVSIFSVTEKIDWTNSHAKHQFRLLLCSSTYESEKLSFKVKQSVSYRRSKGHYIGGAPFGYKTEFDDKRIRQLKENKDEMKIIDNITKKFCTESKNYTEIEKELVKEKITFRGRKPTISGIKRIISKHKDNFIGTLVQRKNLKNIRQSRRKAPF